ncbi:MAG: ThuA domain-containing protein [Hyphomonadaceae bacterium]|nr:ThuA domain-containing protein [Hyphomonadaceae bacterium]
MTALQRTLRKTLGAWLAIGLLACAACAQNAATTPPQAKSVTQTAPAQANRDPLAGRKRLLVIADLHTGHQTAHLASASRALGELARIGSESGAYVAILRTDTQLVTKGETWGAGDYAKGGSKQSRGRSLDYFDAVLFFTNGELDLSDQQKQDLLDFIAKDGKGFIGIHTATATAYGWPEYGEMIGGYFDNHPWMVADGRVIVERPDFPGMAGYAAQPSLRDEFYQMKAPYSRGQVDVLMRLDPATVDLKAPMVHRTDADFPLAWIKSHGKGRVFYSALGHTDESWDDSRMRDMLRAGILWAMGGEGSASDPHPPTADSRND